MKDCPIVNIKTDFERKRIINKCTYSKPQTRIFCKRKTFRIHSAAQKILIQEKANDLAENTGITENFLKEIDNLNLSQTNDKYKKKATLKFNDEDSEDENEGENFKLLAKRRESKKVIRSQTFDSIANVLDNKDQKQENMSKNILEEFNPDSKINCTESRHSISNNNEHSSDLLNKDKNSSLANLDVPTIPINNNKMKKSLKKIPIHFEKVNLENNELIFERVKEFPNYFKEGNISQILRKNKSEKFYSVNKVLEIERIKKKMFAKKK